MKPMNLRFTITVTEELLKEIDDFRYGNRYPTRTQAVNELFSISLEAIKKKRENAEKTASPMTK